MFWRCLRFYTKIHHSIKNGMAIMEYLSEDVVRYVILLCPMHTLNHLRSTSHRFLNLINAQAFLLEHFDQYWEHAKPSCRGARLRPQTWRDYTKCYHGWHCRRDKQRQYHGHIKGWQYFGHEPPTEQALPTEPSKAKPTRLTQLWQSPAVQADVKRWPHDRISVWDFSGNPDLARSYFHLYHYVRLDYNVNHDRRTLFGLINFEPVLPNVKLITSSIEASLSTRKSRRKAFQRKMHQKRTATKKEKQRAVRRKRQKAKQPTERYRF